MSTLVTLFILITMVMGVCAQEPYLYIVFHGGSGGQNTVWSYTLQGEVYNQAVTQGDANANNLRSGVLLSDGTLLVDNAISTDSRIAHYGQCDSTGTRQFLGNFATTNLAHPYGLAVGTDAARGDEVVWASNQDSCDLVQFSATGGAFQEQVKQFGQDALRGLAYDSLDFILYLADETQNAVIAYDTSSDSFDSTLNFENINDPIGMYIDDDSRIIYIGSNGGSSAASYVYAYDLDSRKLVNTYTGPDLQHPAGIVAYDDGLYVLSQTNTALLRFDIDSGNYTILISNLPDTPEQILLSGC